MYHTRTIVQIKKIIKNSILSIIYCMKIDISYFLGTYIKKIDMFIQFYKNKVKLNNLTKKAPVVFSD